MQFCLFGDLRALGEREKTFIRIFLVITKQVVALPQRGGRGKEGLKSTLRNFNSFTYTEECLIYIHTQELTFF